MMRFLVLAATAATPAAAQEFTTVNPADWSRPLVMHSTIDAQARQASRKQSSDAEARATCANIPRVAKRYGMGDPRVRN